MDNNPWKIIENELSTKSPIGLKDNSNVQWTFQSSGYPILHVSSILPYWT